MRKSLIALLVLISISAVAAPAKLVRVHLRFVSKNTDLQMKVYELPLERGPDAGETAVTPLAEPLPKYNLIGNGFNMKKGAIQPFLMVIDNPSNDTKYFFATTHSILPETASVGFRMNCLCNNHVFQVPPKSRWTRIGTLSLESFVAGQLVGFTHKLIGLSKNEIKEKGLEKSVASPN